MLFQTIESTLWEEEEGQKTGFRCTSAHSQQRLSTPGEKLYNKNK